jgi:hypothetical protein
MPLYRLSEVDLAKAEGRDRRRRGEEEAARDRRRRGEEAAARDHGERRVAARGMTQGKGAGV